MKKGLVQALLSVLMLVLIVTTYSVLKPELQQMIWGGRIGL
jgi:hypothetical protein